MSLAVNSFFDESTYTLSYVVFDENSKDAIIIDPVLDYDPASSEISTYSIERLLEFIKLKELKLHYVLETHAHADHITGASEIKKRMPEVKIGINKNITKVQKAFSRVFNLKDLESNGKQFDILLDEDNLLVAGTIEVKTLFTPGHTPACSSFLIQDRLFVGDVLFLPDSGTGRCDFPDGSPEDLYLSVTQKIYKLPDETKIYVGHDYQPDGRELRFQTTVLESKKTNKQLREGTSIEEFIKFRSVRDSSLAPPRLLLPSIQVNIEAGKLPSPEDNGTSYLKMPLKVKG
ncbi:MAG: glyoxylase-like metal-dependent hydrolase (beta-lactamase superfamily II) [Bacteriovoracaceae bacterium]|jgi:glyoxylase-like metal-dependent hydrolase (beta-lactamase superfamily II)